MRYINESLARMTNEEDAFKVRFSSQTILDTNACLAVLAYVDLAPIRAGLASLVSEDVNNELTLSRQDGNFLAPLPVGISLRHYD